MNNLNKCKCGKHQSGKIAADDYDAEYIAKTGPAMCFSRDGDDCWVLCFHCDRKTAVCNSQQEAVNKWNSGDLYHNIKNLFIIPSYT